MVAAGFASIHGCHISNATYLERITPLREEGCRGLPARVRLGRACIVAGNLDADLIGRLRRQPLRLLAKCDLHATLERGVLVARDMAMDGIPDASCLKLGPFPSNRQLCSLLL
jgi:hypothetical protein